MLLYYVNCLRLTNEACDLIILEFLSTTYFSGDRITSLTIDFQHIVQEDAMTILSYASPYNVQLELVTGNNKLRSSGASRGGESTSPKPGRQSPLVHPLVRSSSQSDLNTVSHNDFH